MAGATQSAQVTGKGRTTDEFEVAEVVALVLLLNAILKQE